MGGARKPLGGRPGACPVWAIGQMGQSLGQSLGEFLGQFLGHFLGQSLGQCLLILETRR
jgi:hypothetical protein